MHIATRSTVVHMARGCLSVCHQTHTCKPRVGMGGACIACSAYFILGMLLRVAPVLFDSQMSGMAGICCDCGPVGRRQNDDCADMLCVSATPFVSLAWQ